jgi:hypothetical protein
VFNQHKKKLTATYIKVAVSFFLWYSKKTVSEFDLGYPIVARVKRTIKTAEALGIHGEEAARE